ncbi:hypothetical protein HYFRA_00012259 [Hymenoscyphus fraxineus]|uniref:Uncharacterized protein n=1 Tax=Hymenoscyphus fraxineus TaxID=746836 RepID=A0A9N9L2V8_9HELO|nr:hypothetical protein HYFRA_00012259 [Hymenoscyphus fraxineus]
MCDLSRQRQLEVCRLQGHPTSFRYFVLLYRLSKSGLESQRVLCKGLKAIKGLYRAGELIQELWYFHKEQTFDKHFVKLEKRGSKIYLPQGGDKLLNGLYLYDFLVEGCQKEEDRQAVLSLLNSIDAIAVMQPFVEKLPQDVVPPSISSTNVIIYTEEVSVKVKNPEIDIFTIDTSGKEHHEIAGRLHKVWKVTTINSE